MYTWHEDDEALSSESLIRLATSTADIAIDLDADDVETDGWARHAHAANGFGDGGWLPDD